MKTNSNLRKIEKHRLKQDLLRKKAIKSGVNLIAPETIFLSNDTKFGKNVTINPYVVIGKKVRIGNDVWIGSNVTIEKGTIDSTKISDSVKIDDLVHVGHNSYLGPYSQITVASIIAGRASASDLAGLAVGNAFSMTIFMFFSGVIFAVTPIVAQLYGAKKFQLIGQI